MEKVLELQATEDSPHILLDAQQKIMKMVGPSYPENAIDVYQPVTEWVENIVPQLEGKLLCELSFTILSSASNKVIYELLTQLESLGQGNRLDIHVVWYYDKQDIDMMEIGEDFSDTLNIPIELKVIEE